MKYYLKEIEKDDLDDFMYVNTYAWNETYKNIVSDEFLDKIKKELKQNVKRLKNKFDQTKKEEPDYKRFILYVNNEPVGIFGICKSKEEKYPNSGELCSLYLLNKVKKQGYGRIMFDRAKEELKNMGFKDMIVCCLNENPSIEFYKHMGGLFVYNHEKTIGERNLIENIYYYKIIKKNL